MVLAFIAVDASEREGIATKTAGRRLLFQRNFSQDRCKKSHVKKSAFANTKAPDMQLQIPGLHFRVADSERKQPFDRRIVGFECEARIAQIARSPDLEVIDVLAAGRESVCVTMVSLSLNIARKCILSPQMPELSVSTESAGIGTA
ncbi:hypothetical protein [Caballeronia calidae]|uniref:hypothetical protein n=1 Tax=Caballeronia calidae TaxID=1777139 RepID=UPI0012FD2A22|nr:hypothetical protein [Caballeronia calidae]